MSEHHPSIIIAGHGGNAYEAVLERAGFDNVRRAVSPDTLTEMCAEQPADVILIAGLRPDDPTLECITALRAEEAARASYTAVVISLPEHDLPELPQALRRGVDDHLVEPSPAEAVANRLRGAARLSALERSLLRVAREAEEENWSHVLNGMLTGLGNRNYLIEHLNGLLAETRARGGMTGCAVLEVDHLATLTQRHGLIVRDEILHHVAQRLRTVIRPIDFMARLGEDRFGVALRYTGTTHHRPWIFERIVRAIAHPPIPTSAGELSITVSVGAYCTEGKDIDAAEALECAARHTRDAQEKGGDILVTS